MLIHCFMVFISLLDKLLLIFFTNLESCPTVKIPAHSLSFVILIL